MGRKTNVRLLDTYLRDLFSIRNAEFQKRELEFDIRQQLQIKILPSERTHWFGRSRKPTLSEIEGESHYEDI